MKALLARDAFLQYPDHNKRFDIYCDASDLQLGAAILQEVMPVADFSRKLNSAQCNYTVGKKEILSIAEHLRNFAPCCIVALIYMSLWTIRTTRSTACRHSMSCSGSYSWMTVPSHSITSKVTATCLLTLCPVYLLMRGRTPMLHLVMTMATNTNLIHKLLQVHARGS
jgi:RNase H-like domain found in reverse transcriptase